MKKLETRKLADIHPYENNPRRNDEAVAAVAESIKQCGYIAPIVVDEGGVILAGHTRYKALRKLRRKAAEVIVIDGLSEEQKRKYRILDNKAGELAEWDEDLLRVELDGLDFEGFDFAFPAFETLETVAVAGYERRKTAPEEAETDEELDEDDPEYQAFVEKFQPKKTTDDCYTPELVYQAVASFVAKEYGLNSDHFVRPFYPGGDYRNYSYDPQAVVVDNPPFSIISEIVAWYAEHGIKFFLFAPALTLFSAASGKLCTALPAGVSITYENGANVGTSFLTNLEDPALRVRVRPDLYRIVEAANDENLRATRRSLPKYSYPDHVLTSMMAARWAKYGVEFALPVAESLSINELDAQKDKEKTIFGKGYLMSTRMAAERAAAERAAAERAAAERAAAERAAAERWELSDRERELIRQLDEAVKM